MPTGFRSSPHASILTRPTVVTGVALALVLAFVVLGHDGRRVVQLMALALPAVAWLAWPVRRPAVHGLRAAVVFAWLLAFIVDGTVRGFMLDQYQAAPDSATVSGALANTVGREAQEYVEMHWRAITLWVGAALFAGLLAARLALAGARGPAPVSIGVATLMGVAVLATIGIAASSSWRRLHPLVYWPERHTDIAALRAGWADRQRERDGLLARAVSAAPFTRREGPSTVVLVLTDSVNRDNLSLYGYPRKTTPRLDAERSLLGSQMLVLRHAWSADASTLPSLANILQFGASHHPDRHHVLALARAAGYKVWWMSNHDDIAVEQQHARLADVVEMINRVPGRAGASLDGELLDCVQEALDDPAARKLIVVHLMGAHPHYRLRFPVDQNPFDDGVDAVERSMRDQGRAAWVRRFRQEYDAALLYHDFVVAETLRITRGSASDGQHRAWMYLSDHGQEVGHGGDQAGHSPGTASGYRIPAVVWRNGVASGWPDDLARRPFRADWAAWTLADLLALEWRSGDPGRNVLAPNYRWHAPALPVAVASFEN